MFRKQIALALAMAFLTICFGCADELNAPITEDETPLIPPSNVRALALGDGSVQLLWDASSQPTVEGYKLYRREVDNGSPRRLNPNRLQATGYLDGTPAPNREYEYRVTAVNSKGKESRHTAIIIETHELIGDGAGKGISISD